jgi:hypothetical protein
MVPVRMFPSSTRVVSGLVNNNAWKSVTILVIEFLSRYNVSRYILRNFQARKEWIQKTCSRLTEDQLSWRVIGAEFTRNAVREGVV